LRPNLIWGEEMVATKIYSENSDLGKVCSGSKIVLAQRIR
jgi:hypothetical protein